MNRSKSHKDLNKEIEELVNGIQKDILEMKKTVDKKNKQFNQYVE